MEPGGPAGSCDLHADRHGLKNHRAHPDVYLCSELRYRTALTPSFSSPIVVRSAPVTGSVVTGKYI